MPNFSRAINLDILDCSNCTSLVELWSEDDHRSLVNLREIRFRGCVNLRKIPNVSRAINLKILDCSDCKSLVELWNEDDHMGLVNLREIRFGGCLNLRKIPNISRAINLEILDCSNCTSLVELWNEDDHMGFVNLREIRFRECVNLRKIPNFSRAINLEILDCSNCTSLVELWNEEDHMGLVNLREIRFRECVNLRKIPNFSRAINLEILDCSDCTSLVELWNEDDHMGLVNLRTFQFGGCMNLRKIPNFSRAINLEILDCSDCTSLVELWNEDDYMGLVNLKILHLDGCVNLRKIPNLSRAINLQILDCSNCTSLVELWNEDDHMDLIELKKIYFSGCVNLKKIPNLLGAINLKFLDCSNCESLVQLPCLDHLASLHHYSLRLNGCYSLKKFPQVPSHFRSLNLSETGIEEVPDSIKNLHKLETLLLANSQVKKVSIKMEFLRILYLSGCPMVELLSELPPYLKVLTVNDCKSLEKVSFADQNLNQFDSLNDDCEYFFMLFCNCFKLNQESTNNIEANAMLKIGSLAEKWAARSDWKYRRENFPSLVCCFPGHEISANKFKYRSLNSSLSLKIAPNRGSGSRFLVFAICLVANLGHRHDFLHLLCSCEYQLTAAGGGNGGVGCENFRSEIPFSLSEPKYMGYHVFILSSIDMVIEDKNYEEASFKFYIRLSDLRRGGKEYIKVERCGVHVLYVDKKSDTGATEKRVAGNKRSFSRDGEEGDGGLKRLK